MARTRQSPHKSSSHSPTPDSPSSYGSAPARKAKTSKNRDTKSANGVKAGNGVKKRNVRPGKCFNCGCDHVSAGVYLPLESIPLTPR